MKSYSIIKNGIITTSDFSRKGTILINSKGIIEDLIYQSESSDPYKDLENDSNIIDARGLNIVAGVIDSHVHMRDPGHPHKGCIATETKHALLGGVTAVMDMPNTLPNTLFEKELEDKCSRARGHSWVDYAFYIGANSKNIASLKDLEKSFACCGIKVFMGPSTGNMLFDGPYKDFKDVKGVIAFHAEDAALLAQKHNNVYKASTVVLHSHARSRESAIKAVEFLLNLEIPVHILHVGTKEEAKMVEIAKKRGRKVTAELCPHHLLLSEPECYIEHGALAQVNPPVRSKEDNQYLAQALKAGVFDTLGSDHAPHSLKEKAMGYGASPSGMVGSQTLLPLMLDCVNKDMISMQQLVKMLCENPAKLYGVKGRGFIKKGFEATFTILDMNKTNIISKEWLGSHADLSPFLNRSVQGWPVGVILRGKPIMQDGVLIEQKPLGEVLRFNHSSY